jgi:hypothetical protein
MLDDFEVGDLVELTIDRREQWESLTVITPYSRHRKATQLYGVLLPDHVQLLH